MVKCFSNIQSAFIHTLHLKAAQPKASAPLYPHLQDHLCTGHAFHHYLSVAGRCFAEHLGAYGGQIQQDCLQGVSVKEELVG